MLTVLLCIVFLLPSLLDILFHVQLIPITLSATVLSGGVIGMIFGVVNSLYVRSPSNVGSMYAFDVFGSSIGALTICPVLLPVLGIQETSVFLSMLLAVAVLAAFQLRKHA
jgi:hypothetical protein